MTFIPAASARFLKPSGNERSLFDRLAGSYQRLVALTLRLRWGVIGLAIALCAGATWGIMNIGHELFPKVDSGQFMILARAQPGTPLAETEVLVEGVERQVMEKLGKPDPNETDETSDLKLLISNIGVLYDWPAGYTPNAGPMDAFLLVQLKDDRKQTAQQWARELRNHLAQTNPGVEFAFDTGGMMTAALNFGLPAPINIQRYGAASSTSSKRSPEGLSSRSRASRALSMSASPSPPATRQSRSR